MKKSVIIGVVISIIILVIIGVIFIKSPVKQEVGEGEKEETKEIGQPSSEKIGEPDAKWVFEGLRLSGEMVDTEVFEISDGSYALHIPFNVVAYSPDGLTWTMSEDKAINEGSSILKLPDGGYRAWWSICGDEGLCDIMSSFSSDGYNWEEEIKLTSSNIKNPYGTLPFVVMLPDETYRMYYARAGSETHTQPNLKSWLKLPDEMLEMEFPVYNVYSAHSSDGLVWEEDPGVRINGAGVNEGHASSGDVYIREDGKYEMVYSSGWGNIAWAVSEDGLSWTHMGITDFKGMDPVVHVFSDGTVRMYYDNWIAIYGRIEEHLGIDTSGLPETINGMPPGVYSAVREPIQNE